MKNQNQELLNHLEILDQILNLLFLKIILENNIINIFYQEGKTFCAKNLASIYAMSGKKTLLVGADMRKPKMFLSFSNDNNIGLSTFLSRKSNKNEIIFSTNIKNLDYIKSGPIPQILQSY